MGWYQVTDTIHHTDEVVVHLTIDGEELETTPEHPFYVEGKGWVDAEDLQIGDHIRNADGETGEVEFIEIEETSQEMYNLTVEEAHTFFVGDGQWLVHNACDFRRIAYGSDEMSRAVQQFRLDLKIKKGYNIAAFQIDGPLPKSLFGYFKKSPDFLKVDGNLFMAKNIGQDGAHSEQVLYAVLMERFEISPSQVTAVYSEFSPCGLNYNNCLGLLNDIFRNSDYLPVNFSFVYPDEKYLKDIATQMLFKNRRPGLITP